MRGLLARFARASRRRVAEARERTPLRALALAAHALPPARRITTSRAGFDLIAEVKFASPSAGVLAPGGEDAAGERARCYAAGGACAISVLTESEHFGGSLAHLRRVAAHCPVPVLRKDFLVDPYQVWEARAAGADGVLLIARLLGDVQLAGMLAACDKAGVFALVEAFDAADLLHMRHVLARKRTRVQVLAGVNGRDLTTLEVDLGRTERMGELLPPGHPAVAESGLREAPDAGRVARAGYGLALVGTALMRSDSPADAVRAFLAEGRAVKQELACPSA